MKELARQGITVTQGGTNASAQDPALGFRTKSERIDMNAFKSPVLTERHLSRLHELTGEVIVPKGTVITPKAREYIKAQGLILTFE